MEQQTDCSSSIRVCARAQLQNHAIEENNMHEIAAMETFARGNLLFLSGELFEQQKKSITYKPT